MVTVKDCVEQIEAANPEIKIVSVKDYGSDYLLTYRSTKGENAIDPFIKVNKSTGKTQEYTIAEDPSRYYSAKELLS